MKGEGKMKKRYVLFSVLMMVFFLVGIVISGTVMAQKKPVVLRLVIPAPEGDWPLTFKDKEMAKRFNERAKGEYIIQVHAGGALAKLPEYFDAVRIGAVEIADGPWGMYSFLDPRLGVIELPFLFNSMGAVTAACKPLVPIYDQLFQEKFNAKGLGMVNTGGLQLFSTKPVKTLEDMKGLLVGAISPPAAEMTKQLGGSPVTVMWTDFYESLQKKVIEAVTMSSHGGLVMGMTDVCKHLTIFHGIAAYNGFSINLDVWKKMPPNIQKILQEEVDKTVDWFNITVMTKLGDDDMKAIKGKGVSIYIVPKAERDRWEKLFISSNEKQIASFGDFGQKVKKVADDMNKRYPYTERGMY
jgi:TRAP-type C4-dicarboxylate transport system substrate-binding protein